MFKIFNFTFQMLLYIEACKAGSLFDGILSESSNSKANKNGCSNNIII